MVKLLKSLFPLFLGTSILLPVDCARVRIAESDGKPIRNEIVRHEMHSGISRKTRKVSIKKGNSIVSIAEKFIGLPYKYGGTTPEGFDCSGFTSYVYKEAGYKIPRDTVEQFDSLNPVRAPKKGDLVFFKISGNRISHVGIYVGKYKFIHSPRTGKNVDYADMRNDYCKQRYAGSRTIVK